MCLYSNTNIPKKAIKDIICYKVIKIISNKYWTGIYYNSHYFPFGKAYACDYNEINWNTWDMSYMIEGGYFHAKTTIIQAKILCIKSNGFKENYYKVVKCIIPKGNEYFISTNGDDICSSSMIVYKDLDSYDKNMRCKCSAIIIYFKTIINKLLNIFK